MNDNGGLSVQAYVKRECAAILGRHDTISHPPRDVVIYGFGRIGRLVTRLLVKRRPGDKT